MSDKWNEETDCASWDLASTSIALTYVENGGRDVHELELMLKRYYHEWISRGSETWRGFVLEAVFNAFTKIDFPAIAKDLMESAIEIDSDPALTRRDPRELSSRNKRPVQKRRAAKKKPATRRG